MLNKYRKIILTFIILLGFALRFYAAISCSIVWDERNNDLPSAREISFDSKNLNLPLVDKRAEGYYEGCGPMAGRYLIRLGWYIFGDSLLGARLPFVIIGTVTILLVYLLAKSALGTEIALLSSFLLSISQFSISTTRIADPSNPPIQFIAILSLLLFYKALKDFSKKLVLVNGLLIGIGFWFKENILFLIPIYIIFLLLCPENRLWLKDKYLWISFVIAFFVMLPVILLSLSPDATRFRFICRESTIGISINALGLYLGELILLAIKPFPELFKYVANSLDNEYTMVNFVLGILILAAVVKSLRDKKPFIRLLVVFFLFNFIIFCFIRRGDIIQSYWSLGSLDWSSLNFIPGIILTANMLCIFIKRRKLRGSLLCGVLIIFMLIRAWDVVTFPLNAFFPRKAYLIEKNYFIYEAEGLLREGNSELAKDMLRRIYKVTNKKPIYKKRAALRLAEILLQEGQYEESGKYLDYVLSQDFDNRDALSLLERLYEQNKHISSN